VFLHDNVRPHTSTAARTRRGMLTSGVVFLHDNARPHTAARTRTLLEHFNWELFDRRPYSPDLAPSDYHLFICLRTGWDHSVSKIMRSWWKVSKRHSAHRRKISLTEAYKNLFPETASASIPGVTSYRSSLSMLVYLYIFFFSMLVC
jgi:hypothetical protein